MSELQAHNTRWRSEREGRAGSYRGVAIEVVRWRSLNADGTSAVARGFPEWTWNYYLYLPLAQIPERLRAAFNRPPEPSGSRLYYKAPDILHGLPWHGDITLFDKEGGADGTPVTFKVGCDYAHSFDRYHVYAFDDVVRDARRTVDALWEAIPDMHLRCGYNGQWYAREDGFWTRDGEFMSYEGARAVFAWWLRRKEAPHA